MISKYSNRHKILRQITEFPVTSGNVARMQPTILLVTDNGIGMGHLARTVAIAQKLKGQAEVVIASMSEAVSEVNPATGIKTFYIPSRRKVDIPSYKWESFLRDRILQLVKETNAQVVTFDGVIPFPGILSARLKNNNFKLVWIRRGFWQRKLHTLALGMQSSLMDAIIEPTDFASESDIGPTAKRKDAIKVTPVSLFDSNTAQSKENARKTLGLDPVKPAVLVQLGTGAADVNQKMTAALKGLIGWKDCQVVLTKDPKDSSGKSLAPGGLDLKIIRYFPLANLLNAFDGAVSAAGYNGVHELLAAKIPTVLVPNIRGTDDQVRRAKWCQDNGFALFADQSDLNDIESQVRKLQDEQVRNSLAKKCENLPEVNGAKSAAELLLKMANDQKVNTHYSMKNQLIVKTLFILTLTFRFLKSLIKTR